MICTSFILCTTEAIHSNASSRWTHGKSDQLERSPQDLEGLLGAGRAALVRVNQQRLSLVVLLDVGVRAVVRHSQNTETDAGDSYTHGKPDTTKSHGRLVTQDETS